ncbi:MAG: T9SS type A sorting domain-containing protein [candidate division Zixibacteria bacterium]|nr:T9SS type A sorting domain-containing protein [candidate division Zixibacteria bacterium]
MSRSFLVSITAVAILSVSSFASVINIPDDYPTIQQGINSSSDGDTVLVQSGTYYESLNFNGHDIVLCSEYLFTGDTTYISSTIIDAQNDYRVVTFDSGEDSSAVITGFTIQNGYASSMYFPDDHGGGIFCDNSTPIIKDNVIKNNDAYFAGGGIACWYCAPTITDNVIEGNNAINGAGVFCSEDSNPMIIGNIIRDNEATEEGGGICCYYPPPPGFKRQTADYLSFKERSALRNPTDGVFIEKNTISGNLASYGGGIFARWHDATISKNLIRDNFAFYGGGIYSMYTNTTIFNSTIIENGANWGGGICTSNDYSLSVTNTIAWNNDSNYQIYVEEGDDPQVTYSDVEGGWWGEGNIDADPMFVDPGNGYFDLGWGSPCIDAGDPNSPYDPDGTIADMGAFYFHQADIVVDMKPVDAPITVPAGGYFNYDGKLINLTSQTQTTDLSLMLIVPELGWYGPIKEYNSIQLAPEDSVFLYGIRQNVPGYAPLGNYKYIAYCGDYPDEVVDSCYFGFEVVSGNGGYSDSWDQSGWLDKYESPAPTADRSVLLESYPNPFNAQTMITFSLPESGKVSLKVYNIKGQLVAKLADGEHKAGSYSVVWDASQYSSGVYFYKLEAGDRVHTKRMTLLK